MTMPADTSRRRVDWAEVAVVTALLAFVLWHAYVTYSASQRITNLLMVVPVTGAFVLLWLAIVWRYGFARRADDPVRPPIIWTIPALMALFALYVATVPILGFDGGTALFTFACLVVLGERHLVRAAVYSLGLGLLIGLMMGRGLAVDGPTLLF